MRIVIVAAAAAILASTAVLAGATVSAPAAEDVLDAIGRAQGLGLDAGLIDEREPARRAGGEDELGATDHHYPRYNIVGRGADRAPGRNGQSGFTSTGNRNRSSILALSNFRTENRDPAAPQRCPNRRET